MSDWRFEFTDGAHSAARDQAEVDLELRLDTCSARVGRAQSDLQRAVGELIPLVQEAAAGGMPVDRVASFARIAAEDVQRILDTGRLY